MSDPRADVALLVDFSDLRHNLCPETPPCSAPEPEVSTASEVEGALPEAEAAPLEAGEEGREAPQTSTGGPDARELGRHLFGFASQIGRVALARAYADWSRCWDLAQELNAEHLEPVFVPCTGDGEDRSHIRLVVDALEALYAGDEPDAYVIVTGDPTLLPLIQKLRADGSEVMVVTPARVASKELRAAADRFYSLEEVMNGVVVTPARPREWHGTRAVGGQVESSGHGHGRGHAGRPASEGRRERPPHPTPVTSERGFDVYDWGPFVALIDELEHRLPFVGVRYLVNKVLAPHNCGIDDPRLKRNLMNRAVEDDLIEMYPVGNVGDRADPVTACRLNRGCTLVIEALGETTTPEPPPEHEPGHEVEPDPEHEPEHEHEEEFEEDEATAEEAS